MTGVPTTTTTPGPTAVTNALLAAALDYAGRGWRVVPLHPRDKKPRGRDWVAQATTDPDQVRREWRHVPAGNVGVALGSGSGVVAIDVDTEEGSRQLAGLAGGDLPDTVEMTTGKGSRLLFQIPDGLEFEPKTAALKGADGGESLRFQGHGGQCVMPPSVHPSGKVYAWVEGRSPADLDPAPMPGWLIAAMEPPPPEPEHPPADQIRWADPRTSGPAQAFSPGTDFNRRGDWDAVLREWGARPAYTRAGVQYWTRPDKKHGVSASVGYCKAADGTPALYVWSGNWPKLQGGKAYDLFGAYARIRHGGDFAAAAAALAAQGYGAPARGPGPNARTAGGRPAPAPAAAEPAGWPDPTPLDDPARDAPPFPLHVLPAALQDLVAGSAEACGAPPDFAAAHALGVAAGVIGAACDLRVKRGWDAPCSLWVCVVAPPGGGKSPSVGPVLAPVFREQARRRREGDARDALVSDVTVAKLAEQMSADPRGQLMVWDEMAGWLTSYDQYKGGGRGNDRAHYLSIWDGRALKVDRKGAESTPVWVVNPRLSVVGGIQPEVLDQLRAGPADGLFDRFLFCYPADRGLAVEEFAEAEDDGPARAWGHALRQLWDLPMRAAPSGDQIPHPVPLAAEARPAWSAWSRELAAAAAAPDAPPYFRAVAAKIAGYTARLTLVAHLLREAYRESSGAGVGAEAAGRGIDLARYFLAHALRVRRAAGRDPRLAGARAVLRWALGREEAAGPHWTRSDVWRSVRRGSLFHTPEDLDGPLDLLEEHRLIRCTTDADGRGRRPAGKGVFELNPKAHAALA